VPDHGDVPQPQLIDERFQVGGVVGEPVADVRFAGTAHTDQIQGQAPG
jgi:hypothetical protein